MQRKASQYADLRSETAFPTFDDLPGEYDVSLDYYESGDGFRYHPRKHWCFLAEITDVVNFLRLRLIVKDKTGHNVPVAFHTDDRGFELDSSCLRKGFTVAIIYAVQHQFLDSSVGIRLEDPTAIKIFPVSLERLFLLSDKIQRFTRNLEGVRTCQACDKEAASLKKCARCGIFWYCDKSCQIAGWNEQGHKADCKLLKDTDLRKLFIMEWEGFEHYYGFALEIPEEA